MGFRVMLAALLGGALVFVAGAVEHMVFGWAGRQMKTPTNATALGDAVKANCPEPGVYYFPNLPKNYNELSPAEKKNAEERMYQEYKNGPAAFIVVPPVGEDMMAFPQLAGEFATDVIAALLVAIVLSATRPGLGCTVRWLLVVLLGLFSWVAINASYALWYRFPLPFVLDELYCALFEWALGGMAIAALVVPREKTTV